MSIDCCKSYVGKQIIGLLPDGGGTPPTTCLYKSDIIQDNTGPNCFLDPTYDFNGQGIDFNAAAAVYGGYAVNDGDVSYLPYGGDTCSKVMFFYVGTTEPSPIQIFDPIFGAYTQSLSGKFCSYGCLTTNSIELKNTYYGIDFGSIINVAFTSYGTSYIDFVNDLAGAEFILGKVFSKYFPGSVINVTDDGFNYFTITWNNVYFDPSFLDFALTDSGGNLDVSITMVEC